MGSRTVGQGVGLMSSRRRFSTAVRRGRRHFVRLDRHVLRGRPIYVVVWTCVAARVKATPHMCPQVDVRTRPVVRKTVSWGSMMADAIVLPTLAYSRSLFNVLVNAAA